MANSPRGGEWTDGQCRGSGGASARGLAQRWWWANAMCRLPRPVASRLPASLGKWRHLRVRIGLLQAVIKFGKKPPLCVYNRRTLPIKGMVRKLSGADKLAPKVEDPLGGAG